MSPPPPPGVPGKPLPGGPRPFGKYVLVSKLALGGMAEIFLAKQAGAEGFERNVVVKRILPNLVEDPSFVTMFLDEARLLAKFSHPNVVAITDFGAADASYFLCMEYLAGEDLGSVLKALKSRAALMPWELACRIIIDASRGLHFSHEFQDERGRPMNVIHRDVSPANLFVTFQGPTKVVDFGIAKADVRMARTGVGVLKGKYRYMPPEQVRQEPMDRRTDIYALGVTLYEALTHRKVFERESDAATLEAIVEGRIPPLREVRPDIPPALERVVLKAMAFRPQDRFDTAEAFAEALEETLGDKLSQASHKRVAEYLKLTYGEAHVQGKVRIPPLSAFTSEPLPNAHRPTEPELRQSNPSLSPVTTPDATPHGQKVTKPGEKSARYSPATAPLPNPPPQHLTGGTQTDRLSATQVKLAQKNVEAARAAPHETRELRPQRSSAVTTESSAVLTDLSPSPLRGPNKLVVGALGVAAVLLSGTLLALLFWPPPEAPPPALAVARTPEPEPATPAEAGVEPEPPAPVAAAEPPPEPPPEAGREPSPGTGEPKPKPGPKLAPVAAAEPAAKPAKKLPKLATRDIQKVIKRATTGVYGCIETHYEDLPSGKGTLVASFVAEPDGTVTNVSISGGGGAGQKPIGACVAKQISALRFPEHEGALNLSMPYGYELE